MLTSRSCQSFFTRSLRGRCAARRITRGSSASAAGDLARQPPAAHDEDPIGERQHLGQVARRHQAGGAADRPSRGSSRGFRTWRRRPRPWSARRAAARAAPSTSHRDTATFCWLPPLSRSGSTSIERALIRQRDSSSSASARSDAADPPRAGGFAPAAARGCAAADRLKKRLCCCRSSGTSTTPARAAARGVGRASGSPSTNTSPRPGRRTPTIDSSSSLRPDPISPKRPDDLARADLERHRRRTPGGATARAARRRGGPPAARAGAGRARGSRGRPSRARCRARSRRRGRTCPRGGRPAAP